MTFPAIRGTPTSGNTGGNVTSFNITLPATIEADDILLVFMGCDGSGDSVSVTGFSVISGTALDTGASNASIHWKRATGTEDGATVACTITTTESAGWVAVAISGAHTTSNPEGTGVTANGAVGVQPPDLSPSWGAEDTLWFGATAWDGGHTASHAAPDWDGLTQNSVSGSGGAGVAYEKRAVNAATMYLSGSPAWGTPTIDSGDDVAGIGVAIRPAAAVVADEVPRPLRIYPQLLAH